MIPVPSDPAPARVSWRAAFGYRDLNCFQGARANVMLGVQMQSVAVGWQIYATTGRPLDLAWVGLAQFLPAAGLSLVTGHAADRFDRRRILLSCHAALAALSLALFAIARTGGGVGLIYAVLVGVGIARAFLGPAAQSMLPTLVPLELFASAVAWGASFFQVATVLGPSLGGVLYGAAGGPGSVYLASGACSLVAFVLVSSMRASPARGSRPATTRSSVLAGVRYVRGNPIVLGAISLDLFAVLLGGATALLPVYARDILHLGPSALCAVPRRPAPRSSPWCWPVFRSSGRPA